jgi:hypothetical protein
MSNLSGLSAILTVSLVALVTIQMLKDKFDVVENYGEDNNNSWTFQPAPVTARNVREVTKDMPTLKQDLSDARNHGHRDLGTGDFFRPPFVSPDANANGWNGFPEAFSVYQQSLNAATPTMENFRAVGAETVSLPGPNVFMNDAFAEANVNHGRANRLSLCAQNFNKSSTPLNVASSLLPNPNTERFEGFESCGENLETSLANQVFLSPGGAMGTNTTMFSNRNGNQSIRSEPPNPVLAVGPWNLSSIFPDLTRRPLEGCGPSFGLYGTGPNSVGTPSEIRP